jgi:hypothetical protein
MRFRASLRMLFWVTAAATILAACGTGGSRSPLTPNVSGAAPAGTSDPDVAIEQAVARAFRRAGGSANYGTIDDGWYAPSPVPGKPGYYVIDGEIQKGPPDDGPPAPAPLATRNCVTFDGPVPPPCTNTGPFRRVYSDPGYSFALASIELPARIATMPTAAPGQKAPIDGDTGYVYFEGWVTSNPNGGNSEFGFQYSAKNNWYSVYYKTYSPKFQVIFQKFHWVPSTVVTFALAGYNVDNQNDLHVALIGTTKEKCVSTMGTTPTKNLCLAHGHSADTGWSPAACCIMARMTTIGQTAANKFYDGVKFGPIAWSGAELAKKPPAPAPGSTTLPLTGAEPPWAGGGAQSWPPQLNKIVVASQSAAAETDTIDLAPLPALTVALLPSTCQYFKSSGTVDYTAKLSGNASGFPLQYGWPPAGTKMTVPGSTLNSTLGVYLGKSATAATIHFAIAGGAGGELTGAQVNLYYTDATGALTDLWNGHTISARSKVALGGDKCPKFDAP